LTTAHNDQSARGAGYVVTLKSACRSADIARFVVASL